MAEWAAVRRQREIQAGIVRVEQDALTKLDLECSRAERAFLTAARDALGNVPDAQTNIKLAQIGRSDG